MERIIKIIHACCILYNICIDMGDSLPSGDINREIGDDIDNDDDEHVAENEGREEVAGVQKREYLANLINL
jgi:hypothetical protein